MFIIIPIAIIFFLFVYLQLVPDISCTTQILIYTLMGTTLFVSWFLYKKVKKDFHQQEINALLLEFETLHSKMEHQKDEKIIHFYQQKIINLQEEIQKKKEEI